MIIGLKLVIDEAEGGAPPTIPLSNFLSHRLALRQDARGSAHCRTRPDRSQPVFAVSGDR